MRLCETSESERCGSEWDCLRLVRVKDMAQNEIETSENERCGSEWDCLRLVRVKDMAQNEILGEWKITRSEWFSVTLRMRFFESARLGSEWDSLTLKVKDMPQDEVLWDWRIWPGQIVLLSVTHMMWICEDCSSICDTHDVNLWRLFFYLWHTWCESVKIVLLSVTHMMWICEDCSSICDTHDVNLWRLFFCDTHDVNLWRLFFYLWHTWCESVKLIDIIQARLSPCNSQDEIMWYWYLYSAGQIVLLRYSGCDLVKLMYITRPDFS